MTDNNLIYGLHAVESALQHAPRTLKEIIILAGKASPKLANILQLAKQQQVLIRQVNKAQFHPLVGQDQNHQGVVAYLQNQQQYNEHDLFEFIENLKKPAFLLVLDSVQDPHNLGACLRTANAAGVDAVIIPKDRSVGLTPVVRKVASGAEQTTPLITVTNLANTLRKLKDTGVWLVGADADPKVAQALYSVDLKGAIAMVMGAEGSGLRRLTKELCDYLVYIPMVGTVESLNVSVATAICLYEAVRQRLR